MNRKAVITRQRIPRRAIGAKGDATRVLLVTRNLPPLLGGMERLNKTISVNFL